MRKYLAIMISVIFVISLVGCGNSKDTSKNSDKESDTKIISTSKGDVEIPVNPQRVIIDYFVGDAIALGVKPVGTTYVHKGAYFEDELEGVPSINGDTSYGDYSMEKIASLKPDLIITAYDTDYNTMSEIAPTVFVDYTNMTNEERMKLTGEILGKEEKALALVEDLNKDIEESKKKLEEAGIMNKTVSLLETAQKAVYAYGDKQGRGGDVMYNMLGLKAPEVIQKDIIGGEQWRSVSFEVLGDYVGDYVLIGGWDEDPMAVVGNNPVWNSTEAVKSGRVIVYESHPYIYQDIYTTKIYLKEIVDKLIEKSK